MAIENSGLTEGIKTIWFDTDLPQVAHLEHVQVPNPGSANRSQVGFYVPKGPPGDEFMYWDEVRTEDETPIRRAGRWPNTGVAPYRGDFFNFNVASGVIPASNGSFSLNPLGVINYQVPGSGNNLAAEITGS